jgi:hypothetical protein
LPVAEVEEPEQLAHREPVAVVEDAEQLVRREPVAEVEEELERLENFFQNCP